MLTSKEQAFCQYYLALGGDGAAAVREAGYRSEHPERYARRLLARKDIRLTLEELLRDELWRQGLSPQYLARRARQALDAALDARPVLSRGKELEGHYEVDAKSAMELLKLLGKWTGLEDCGDRKLNHEGARMTQPTEAAPGLRLEVPRPAPGEWEAAREEEP